MKIPKRFKLFGRTITVEYNQNEADECDFKGATRWRKDQILLANPNVYKTGTAKGQEQTFCHELVHYILYLMRNEKLGNDEDFVDLFASCLHQVLDTMEYK